MLRVLDLFSGIGGFSLGLERTGGFETVAFCEIEDYPRRVLAKHWPDVPIFPDVRELTKEQLPSDIRLICGGYPCQPFSTAGKRAGQADDRHLWPEVDRLIREIRPHWCIFENVAGHISMGLDQVLSDLEAAGYSWESFVIPACGVDAPHRRDRVWIIAHAGLQQSPGRDETAEVDSGDRQEGGQALGVTTSPRCDVSNTGRDRDKSGDRCGAVADPAGQRQERWLHPGNHGEKTRGIDPGASSFGGGQQDRTWPIEPGVGRVANGVPARVDRLKCLGNAVVPQVVEVIGRAILQEEAVRRGIEIVGGMHVSQEALDSGMEPPEDAAG